MFARMPGRLAVVLAALPAATGLAGTVNRAGILEEEPADLPRRRLDDEPNPYVCPEGVKASKEQWKVSGTNLGGWLVLEPWITPSLFYQFLGMDVKWGAMAGHHTAMDTFTFCQVLGPEKANKQLRQHWKTWVREQDIAAIAATGATHVRIPIGDWQYIPYGPYIGCMDGANEELDRALALCEKYGLKVLLDIHAVRNSQNGFDNSGEARRVKWTTVTSQGVGTSTIFEHWPLRSADWMGKFELTTLSYPEIDHDNVNFTLQVISKIVQKYASSPSIWGLEPVNEPWQFIPIEPLKQFYWDAYWITRKTAPHWKFVMHDGFRGYPAAWWDFMKGCPNKAMDSHIYLAWANPGPIHSFLSSACSFRNQIWTMEDLVDMPIIVGEWSLATDNCAMWLNGFNDNLPGYPKVSCQMMPCPAPYMGWSQPGCPPDASLPLQGPFGTGVSGPENGKCPIGVQWGDSEQSAMTALASKQIHSFNQGHGWMFWNFRTELEDRWSYLASCARKWFPANVSSIEDETADACLSHSCEDQLANDADGASCGMRIDWLVLNQEYTVADARIKVGHEFPEQCGLCAAFPPASPPTLPHGTPELTLEYTEAAQERLSSGVEPSILATTAETGATTSHQAVWGMMLGAFALAVLALGGYSKSLRAYADMAQVSTQESEFASTAASGASEAGAGQSYVPF
ncbi:hypothetical protein AB1Y20_007968 [Prymnesium parvum]|uniref:Glycoside hydrolase family 5 domain-containing protein n=1 Tax=Prymnesium parvum TaxID=97485 RepID=A0AB34IT18_PRYPA